MPPNAGVIVLGEKNVLNSVGADPGKLCGAFAHRKNEIGNWLRLLQALVVVVVAPAEALHAPLAKEAVEVEFLEWQCANVLDQDTLDVRRDDLALVAKSLGVVRGFGEEIDL